MRMKFWVKIVLALIALLPVTGAAEAETLMVEPGQSIQEAVEAASPGDIIEVQAGSYYENLNITKPLKIIGIGNPVVDAGGRGSAIMLSAGGITLEGLVAVNASCRDCSGIKVISDGNEVLGNVALGNYEGITIEKSRNNTLKSNNVTNNLGDGIDIEASSNNSLYFNEINGNGDEGLDIDESSDSNIVIGNRVAGNEYGLSLENSRGNVLKDNLFLNNTFGIFLLAAEKNVLSNNTAEGNSYNFGDLGSLEGLRNEIDTTNLVDGKPIYYLVGARGVFIDQTSNAGIVYCIDCEGITVRGISVSDNFVGIGLYNVSNSTVVENYVSSSVEDGIQLFRSSNCTVVRNTAAKNDYEGLCVLSSSGIRIEGNNFSANGDDGLHINKSSCHVEANAIEDNENNGMFIEGSHGCVFRMNSIEDNGLNGIRIEGSGSVEVAMNNVSRNVKDGVSIEGSGSFTIRGNSARRNEMSGIAVYSSSEGFVEGNEVSENEYGISVFTSRGIDVNRNTASDNLDGVHLFASRDLQVAKNNVSQSALIGIYAGSACENSSIVGNIVERSRDGLILQKANNIFVSENSISDNSHEGIHLEGSNLNSITGNSIEGSAYDGLYLVESSHNIIQDNRIINNGGGIRWERSENNTFERNEVEGNAKYDVRGGVGA
jgi:parallel beta-helix repeat protein